ncbi:heavy metal-associated isoprenylated plant protein 9 [Carica papaya]|uniref:heavy metal-associated isoprenylated plant protein 9 n=1 Tax=Carica papaya TaxID=3649 RepID=UPI000B8D0408|nr:heavy metal-associated isoprenylated plant protein 9 [Carica papaya]XP_021909598.1 heavy metal-associated isoprenylated plant protein 9 [Carica papaya]
MGEEAKQEQAKAEAQPEEKPEEKKEEKPEEKSAEESKPPSPFVLFVDLHCVGCAKKIEKSIMRIRGVEGVVTDMGKNQVTIKGVVEPQAICNKIMKKTKRRAQVLSPLPPADGEPMPQLVTSQVSGLITLELNVNMHCEACAEQLKKKILQMRGVQTATTEFSSGKVMVTGTMDPNKLVDYVYRRTKKQARIVPQPDPPQPPEETKKEPDNPLVEESKPEDKKEDNGADQKKEEDPKAAAAAANQTDPPQEPNKEGEAQGGGNGGGNEGDKEEKKEVAEGDPAINDILQSNLHEENMKRMMYYYQYQPVYVIERIPPAPQLFSDENPNACSIS